MDYALVNRDELLDLRYFAGRLERLMHLNYVVFEGALPASPLWDLRNLLEGMADPDTIPAELDPPDHVELLAWCREWNFKRVPWPTWDTEHEGFAIISDEGSSIGRICDTTPDLDLRLMLLGCTQLLNGALWTTCRHCGAIVRTLGDDVMQEGIDEFYHKRCWREHYQS